LEWAGITANVGVTKTAAMVLQGGEPMTSTTLHLGPDKIPICPQYKYLGYVITPNLSWKPCWESACEAFRLRLSAIRAAQIPPLLKLSALRSWAIPTVTYHFHNVDYPLAWIQALDTEIRGAVREICSSRKLTNSTIEAPESLGGFGVVSLESQREKLRFSFLSSLLYPLSLQTMPPTLCSYFSRTSAHANNSINADKINLSCPTTFHTCKKWTEWYSSYLAKNRLAVTFFAGRPYAEFRGIEASRISPLLNLDDVYRTKARDLMDFQLFAATVPKSAIWVFTDGSSIERDSGWRDGGASCVIIHGEKTTTRSKYLPGVTNDEAELEGILLALEVITEDQRLNRAPLTVFCSDSQYALGAVVGVSSPGPHLMKSSAAHRGIAALPRSIVRFCPAHTIDHSLPGIRGNQLADILAYGAANERTDKPLETTVTPSETTESLPNQLPPCFAKTPLTQPKLIAKHLQSLQLGMRLVDLKGRGWVRDDCRQWKLVKKHLFREMIHQKDLSALLSLGNGIPPIGWTVGLCPFGCAKSGSCRHLLGSCGHFHDFYTKRHNQVVDVIQKAAISNGFSVKQNSFALADGSKLVPDIVLEKGIQRVIMEIAVTAVKPGEEMGVATAKIMKYHEVAEEVDAQLCPLVFGASIWIPHATSAILERILPLGLQKTQASLIQSLFASFKQWRAALVSTKRVKR
jgi:ribonuclease HI